MFHLAVVVERHCRNVHCFGCRERGFELLDPVLYSFKLMRIF